MGLGIPIIDDILGGGGGGAGGGSSTLTVNSSTELKPSPLKTEARQELVLPQPFKTETKQELVLPQPFKTETKSESKNRNELAITQPIVTDSHTSMSMDVKPIAVDLCMKMSMGPMPPMCIRQPYQHHFGITMFGVEVLGFSFSGESQVIVQDLPQRPQVEWGPAPPIKRIPRAGRSADSHGLRVRLGEK